ncbi:hypothetical protein [Pseudacidovorax intermedius]|uniref:Uncharacterized protein n=1 Tax=Pseudacidovorax intermedius TaxID=433924 RepID=A0A147H8D9_9BURK|nr:hypothetical protein [Pseudacidovorax intermedius]KTT26181.1 hypothetical protein NS331_03890 [Pseudacidovorax intermedius]
MSTTSLKLPEELKQTIQQFAEQDQVSAHAFMLRTLQDEVRRRQQRAEFLADALAAAAEIDAGGPVYAAEDVFDWLHARICAHGTDEVVPEPVPVRGRGAKPKKKAA